MHPGLESVSKERIMEAAQQRKVIATRIDGTFEPEVWRDWRWQAKNTVRDLETVERLLGLKLTPEKRAAINRTIERFPLAVTPYYLSLIDTNDLENSPIYRQAIPFLPSSSCATATFVIRSPRTRTPQSKGSPIVTRIVCSFS